MKHVPVAAFKDKVSEYVAAAEAGEEIAITRHGKVAARLSPPLIDKVALRRDAVARSRVLGKQILETYGPTSVEEIQAWIEEDRP